MQGKQAVKNNAKHTQNGKFIPQERCTLVNENVSVINMESPDSC